MILGINPTVDYAFKHLLGGEATRPILMNVVDSVLQPAPGHHISDIELLNPFNPKEALDEDRKSTRLNSSHTVISYAVFCLKKKKQQKKENKLIDSESY